MRILLGIRNGYSHWALPDPSLKQVDYEADGTAPESQTAALHVLGIGIRKLWP